jgi:hypothetical protein
VPTILRSGPYRLFFYSADGNEPPHVHIVRDACYAKYWLHPVMLARSKGFGPRELTGIERLVDEHAFFITKAWHEFFRN